MVDAMTRNPHAASRVNDPETNQHRFTPRALIRWLHDQFRFTLDACGHPLSPASQIIGRGYTLVDPGRSGLVRGNCYNHSWQGHRVWLQPDFNLLEEAVSESCQWMRAPGPPQLIVLLMPWNRQEQPFWHDYIEGERDRPGGSIETVAIKGRVKFGTPGDPEGKRPKNSPGFGCGLVIWRGRDYQRDVVSLRARTLVARTKEHTDGTQE